MKRYLSIFALSSVLLFSSAAKSEICFLGDEGCEGGGLSLNLECSDLDYVNLEGKQCSGFNYEYCDMDRGWAKKIGCKAGYCDLKGLGVDTEKYTCANTADKGECKDCCKNPQCKDEYKDCSAMNARPAPGAESCREISSSCALTDHDLYSECVCDPDKYKYTMEDCVGEGLRPSTDDNDKCIDSKGDVHYSKCECDIGWDKKQGNALTCAADCKSDVCHFVETPVAIPGESGYYCWKGTTCDACDASKGLTDYDRFWIGYQVNTSLKMKQCSRNPIVTDCRALGYDTGIASTGTKCKDKTEPFRCPFDHTKVYCESGIDDELGTCPEGKVLALDCDGLFNDIETYNGNKCGKCTELSIIDRNDLITLEPIDDCDYWCEYGSGMANSSGKLMWQQCLCKETSNVTQEGCPDGYSTIFPTRSSCCDKAPTGSHCLYTTKGSYKGVTCGQCGWYN